MADPPAPLDGLGSDDLNLIEAAILRLLNNHHHQTPTPLSKLHKLPDSGHHHSHHHHHHHPDCGVAAEDMGSSGLDPVQKDQSDLTGACTHAATAVCPDKDFALLLKLLEQVECLKSQRYSKDCLPKQEKAQICSKPAGEEKAHQRGEGESREGSGLKEATEAALKAAMAAADAAKAAAASVAKNSEAIKTLLKTLSPQPEEVEEVSSVLDLPQQSEENEEKQRPEKKRNKKDIGKVLEKQNRVTHWILGFMVVATSIWRFKIIQLASRFQHVLTNPFEFLGGKFSEGDHHHHHQLNPLFPHKEERESSQTSHLPLPLPHLELPTILQQNEVETHNQRSKFI